MDEIKVYIKEHWESDKIADCIFELKSMFNDVNIRLKCGLSGDNYSYAFGDIYNMRVLANNYKNEPVIQKYFSEYICDESDSEEILPAYMFCEEHTSVAHPQHYSFGKYEPIDVIADWGLNFNLGNTVKYISRAGRKDPTKTLEDLKKAKFYLDYEIEHFEEKE